jgi:ketosteroid isomerase-like protein
VGPLPFTHPSGAHATKTSLFSTLPLYIKTFHYIIKKPARAPLFRAFYYIFLAHLQSIVFVCFFVPELANSQASLEEQEPNERVVTALYKALSSKDFDEVQRLLAPDLEWWFHGPPNHQHLMRLLTGSSKEDSFVFVPQSIVAFGSTVLVEGYDKERSVSWVHAWTVTDGIITQVREYFNTSVIVARFGDSKGQGVGGASQTISSPAVTLKSVNKCQSVWESKLCDNNSVPGLVLAL